MRKKINFLSSLFSRRDWFETRFVGNPEDRFSRVVACVALSTALGQIFQVQQIIILKTNIMRPNTQVIRNYRPQNQRTAGALIVWLQVSGMTMY